MIVIPKIGQSMIRTDYFSFEELVEKIDESQLKIKGYSFNKRYAHEVALYVQTFLLGKIIGDLAIDISEDIWYVILGQRQLLSIYKFIKGEVIIESGSCFVNGVEVSDFASLPLAIRRKVLNQKIQTTVLCTEPHDPARFQALYLLSKLQGGLNSNFFAKLVFPKSYELVSSLSLLLNSKYRGSSDKTIDLFDACLLYLFIQGWVKPDKEIDMCINEKADLTNALYLQLADLSNVEINRDLLIESFNFLRFKEIETILKKQNFKNRVILSYLLIKSTSICDYKSFSISLHNVSTRIEMNIKKTAKYSSEDFFEVLKSVIN